MHHKIKSSIPVKTENGRTIYVEFESTFTGVQNPTFPSIKDVLSEHKRCAFRDSVEDADVSLSGRYQRGVPTQHGIRDWDSEGDPDAESSQQGDYLLLKGECEECRFKVELSFPNSSEGWATYYRWREELFSHSDENLHTVIESLSRNGSTLSYPIKPSKRAWWFWLGRWWFLGVSVCMSVAACCIDGDWIKFPHRLVLISVCGWFGLKMDEWLGKKFVPHWDAFVSKISKKVNKWR